jgi:hypothetical protein
MLKDENTFLYLLENLKILKNNLFLFEIKDKN